MCKYNIDKTAGKIDNSTIAGDLSILLSIVSGKHCRKFVEQIEKCKTIKNIIN